MHVQVNISTSLILALKDYIFVRNVSSFCLEGEIMQEIPQMPVTSSDKQVKLCALANRLSLIICLLKEIDIRRRSLYISKKGIQHNFCQLISFHRRISVCPSKISIALSKCKVSNHPNKGLIQLIFSKPTVLLSC